MYPDRTFPAPAANTLPIPVPIDGSIDARSNEPKLGTGVALRTKIHPRGRKVAAHIHPVRYVASEKTTGTIFYRMFKTLFDVIGASVLLLCVSPLMIVIALAVRLTSPGKVIFRQPRLTKSGKIFTLYKFRTMYADAEANGAVWAQANDPRVTPLGSFLRMTRLDELPQLFNVLRGDMSLIGPRPERPEFVDELANQLPGFHRRLQVKAGLTGLAQVGNGYSSSLDGHRKKLAWDRLYIRRCSMALDIWIALKTIPVLITGRGAR